MKVAIIGGGAAGFFSAIAVKENYPDSKVVIFEKSNQVLAKVKISGGGRCNLTNNCNSIADLCDAYPRGGKFLKKAFYVFNNKNAIEWFESRGVSLVIQSDNCIFPESQNSQTIIDCLINEAKKLRVEITSGTTVTGLKQVKEHIEVSFQNDEPKSRFFEKVIVTTGGSPEMKGLTWLQLLKHKIEKPVPSLFTFNMPDERITELMGIVVENSIVRIQGAKFKSDGPILITHWGMSGPAILKLSSYAARYLSETNYTFKIQVSWVNEINNERVEDCLNKIIKDYPNKLLANYRPFLLPERLWYYLLNKINLSPDKKWSEIGSKIMNKLVSILTNDIYSVRGRSVFKEEFVTCGGVSLESIDQNTMQSKVFRNLYFAGEVMDIDAITGGFNLQAAWTTAYIAGRLK